MKITLPVSLALLIGYSFGCGGGNTSINTDGGAGSDGGAYDNLAGGGSLPDNAAGQGGQGGSAGGSAGASGTGIDAGQSGAAGGAAGTAGTAGTAGAAGDSSAGGSTAGLDSGIAAPDGGDAANGEIPGAGQVPDICYNNQECKSVDANTVCFGESATDPGYCTDTCGLYTQCEEIAGYDATCSANGACYVACDGPGDTDCPENMLCAEVTEGTNTIDACIYPADAFTGDAEIWQSCDLTHGDNDCQGELVCYRPAGQGGTVPGFCTASCDNTLQCTQPFGVTAEVLCNAEDVCVLDCSGPGSTCPDGMVCRKSGQGSNSPRICTFS